MKTIFYSIICIFGSLSLFSQEDIDIAAAQTFFDQQDYLNAIPIYEKCVLSDSLNIDCYEKLSLSAYRLGDTPKARENYLALEKIDSTNKLALSQLANIFEQDKNSPKAIKYYHKLVKYYPENPVYFRKLAQNYQAAGLLTDAFRYYAEAYKKNGRDLFTIKGISEIFISNKQYAEADSIMLKGLEIDTMNVNLHLLIAQSKYRQKVYDSTVHYLDRIKYTIDFSPYYNKMFGYAYIQIDSFEKSIPLLEKSLVDEGSKEYAHYYLATAYYNLDNMEYALYHYNKALEEGISNNVDLYHRSLAKLYNDDNKLKEAIAHYKDAYKYGDDPLMLFYLARASEIYYKDKSIALNYYKRYIKSKHNNSEYIDYAKERSRHLKELRHQKM